MNSSLRTARLPRPWYWIYRVLTFFVGATVLMALATPRSWSQADFHKCPTCGKNAFGGCSCNNITDDIECADARAFLQRSGVASSAIARMTCEEIKNAAWVRGWKSPKAAAEKAKRDAESARFQAEQAAIRARRDAEFKAQQAEFDRQREESDRRFKAERLKRDAQYQEREARRKAAFDDINQRNALENEVTERYDEVIEATENEIAGWPSPYSDDVCNLTESSIVSRLAWYKGQRGRLDAAKKEAWDNQLYRTSGKIDSYTYEVDKAIGLLEQFLRKKRSCAPSAREVEVESGSTVVPVTEGVVLDPEPEPTEEPPPASARKPSPPATTKGEVESGDKPGKTDPGPTSPTSQRKRPLDPDAAAALGLLGSGRSASGAAGGLTAFDGPRPPEESESMKRLRDTLGSVLPGSEHRADGQTVASRLSAFDSPGGDRVGTGSRSLAAFDKPSDGSGYSEEKLKAAVKEAVKKTDERAIKAHYDQYNDPVRRSGPFYATGDGEVTRMHGGTLRHSVDQLPPFREAAYINGVRTGSHKAAGTAEIIGNGAQVGVRNIYNQSHAAPKDFAYAAIEKGTDGRLGLNAATKSTTDYIRRQIDAGENVGLAAHSEGTLIVKNAISKYESELRADPSLTAGEVNFRLSKIHVVMFGGAAYSEGMSKVGSLFQLTTPNDFVAQSFGAGAEPAGAVSGALSGMVKTVSEAGAAGALRDHEADHYAAHIKPYMWTTSGKAVIPAPPPVPSGGSSPSPSNPSAKPAPARPIDLLNAFDYAK